MPQSQPLGSGAVRLGGTDALRKMLTDLSSDSRKAIQKLLSEIGSITGEPATHTDPLDLFDAISSQTVGGIYVDVTTTRVQETIHKDAWPKLRPVAGGSGFAYHFWSPTTKQVQRLAVILLKHSADPSDNGIERIKAGYLVTTIHEMTHVAPAKKIYDHPEMNRAAKDLGARQFDDYVEKHCIPSKYWAFPA